MENFSKLLATSASFASEHSTLSLFQQWNLLLMVVLPSRQSASKPCQIVRSSCRRTQAAAR